jgi:ABC-type antimicrobial peptide transport system permease subunit
MGTQLQKFAGVQSVSFCFQPPASESNNTTDVRFEARAKDEPWEVNMKQADDQYVNTFGLKIIAGRNFYKSDTARELLVNETFVKKLGFHTPQEVLGKRAIVDGDNPAPIVGVVKDFFNRSFHEDVAPIIIRPNYTVYSRCAVKIAGGDIKPVLAQIEKTWNETYPDYVYSYQFLDDSIAKFYELDDVMLVLIETFAVIAVFIGCLGLYGLVSFMAVRKTKEIGVRKVLGAGMQQILWLFGKEFSKLLLLAFVIAAPIAFWVMTLYLEDFKYRITIGAGIFALSIGVTFLVACLSVGYRSLRAAMANPVKSLRTE